MMSLSLLNVGAVRANRQTSPVWTLQDCEIQARRSLSQASALLSGVSGVAVSDVFLIGNGSYSIGFPQKVCTFMIHFPMNVT